MVPRGLGRQSLKRHNDNKMNCYISQRLQYFVVRKSWALEAHSAGGQVGSGS